MAECFFVEPNEPFHIGTLEENKLNLTLDFHRWGKQAEETPVCVYMFSLHWSLLFSRLITVELQFKLKAINLQTIRHHRLPDCYDFTLTVSVGWANLIPV